MRLTDPPRERRRFQLIALAMGIIIAATAVGFFVMVILAAEDRTSTTPLPTITPTATAALLANVTQGAALTGPVALRSGPAENFAIVTRLAETDEIRVLGRSDTGDWLAIGIRNRPDVTGWVPATSVSGVEVAPLPVITGPGSTAPTVDGTLSPDHVDLIVARAFSQQNQLWVEIVNQGAADAVGGFTVAVDRHAPVEVQVRPGEPLRPGQSLVGPVPGHYLQLRSNLLVTVLPADTLIEEDAENNSWIGIVGPDTPNDLEILEAAAGIAGEPLVVTVRNNSPIPIAGLFTLSVRETVAPIQLLGREQITIEIGNGQTFDVVFEELTDVDMTRVTIIMGTDAIDDANLGNNVYPR
ncbi:MAG: SH3 domain-containing protein [Chloroflexi bacterium]|nr:SH3 domain-containing protein [Chloroflexota bacterium]